MYKAFKRISINLKIITENKGTVNEKFRNFRYDVQYRSMLLYMSKRHGINETLQEINDHEISSTIEYLWKYELKVFPSFKMSVIYNASQQIKLHIKW